MMPQKNYRSQKPPKQTAAQKKMRQQTMRGTKPNTKISRTQKQQSMLIALNNQTQGIISQRRKDTRLFTELDYNVNKLQ